MNFARFISVQTRDSYDRLLGIQRLPNVFVKHLLKEAGFSERKCPVPYTLCDPFVGWQYGSYFHSAFRAKRQDPTFYLFPQFLFESQQRQSYLLRNLCKLPFVCYVWHPRASCEGLWIAWPFRIAFHGYHLRSTYSNTSLHIIILTGWNQSFQLVKILLNKMKGKLFREREESLGVRIHIFFRGGESMLALALLYQSSLLQAEKDNWFFFSLIKKLGIQFLKMQSPFGFPHTVCGLEDALKL